MIFIGVVIGFVMGLTGAGGALVAIPLFMHLQNMNLKEASIFSLIAVVLASLTNFYFQRQQAQYKLASFFIVSSAIGSYLALPFKNFLPTVGLALVLSTIALYSLYSVWIPSQKNPTPKDRTNLLQTLVIGLTLGIITTLTGLGGGVLMLPLLVRIYHLAQKQAVATSLMVVGISSLASFLIQISLTTSSPINLNLLGLATGILVTSYLLKLGIQKIPTSLADILRKVVFTLVVILALIKVFK